MGNVMGGRVAKVDGVGGGVRGVPDSNLSKASRKAFRPWTAKF